MLDETFDFLRSLILDNVSTDALIESDFTFVNRRLAEHYGIPGVVGQEMRRVVLPSDSPRGGLLTHASVLKITANGTTTSPVRRGSWVLTSMLGTPPAPPPPGVGSVEPDTRGATTIRALLEKHRRDEVCASCHREIDPPGFALESFDVIGGYRNNYRSVGEGTAVPETVKFRGRNVWEYKVGLAVDPSGELTDGEAFASIAAYKKLLLKRRDDVAKNVLLQWIAYATGEPVQFCERNEVDAMLKHCQASEYRMKSMLHELILSPLFMNN
jgi:hypothetical protein